MKTIEESLRPPTDAEVERSLARFSTSAHRHYGERLRGLYLYGSRARGDHGRDSDVDVAVVLSDGHWRFWTEVRELSDLSYDLLIDEGVDVQALPIRASEWEDPDRHHNPSFVRSIREDARPLPLPS